MRTEARAWETSAQPERMLELHPPRSDRKGRLLLVACCRTCWDLLPDDSRKAVTTGERLADGRADAREVNQARYLADAASAAADSQLREIANDPAVAEAPLGPGGHLRFMERLEAEERQVRVLRAAMVAQAAVSDCLDAGEVRFAIRLLDPQVAVALLRDIFGNPFRLVTFSPEWRTDTAVSLARQMYESREFSAIPILADALQDAGCDSDDILSHCRDTSLTHVRGCWVVDLVLGKA